MKCANIKIGKIHLLEVDNEHGLRIQLSPNGATLYAIYFHDKIMTLSPKLMSDLFKHSAYYGKTVGPICGRIKNGIITVNGQDYQLEKNEGENTLHSATDSLCNTIFSTKVMNSKDFCSILFTYIHKPKKGDVPGRIRYFISYAMSTLENTLLITHRAIPEKEMILSLTNHAYFSLGEESIRSLKFKVGASQIVEVNPVDMIPERYIPVPECLDFRKGAPLTKDITNPYLINSKTNGIDHYFHLDEIGSPIILESNHVRMEITSDYEGIQVYSDNYADGIEMHGTSQTTFRGVAIEPQDSPLNRRVYTKEHPYNHSSEYRFFEK